MEGDGYIRGLGGLRVVTSIVIALQDFKFTMLSYLGRTLYMNSF